MAEPYLGEIKLVSFSFAPMGWAICSGQVMPIAQNQALFSLLGNSWGGDARTNFALPNLAGRCLIGSADQYRIATTGGETAHTLISAETPAHQHTVNASSAGGALA